jgi:tetratricopeptide (TPR) repeat protein
MGFLDSLFGRKKARAPEEVRRALFEAAVRGNDALLTSLAAEHESVVLEHFATWRRVPEDVRSDPAAAQAYANGLIAVARHFGEVRGRPELIATLEGTASSNVLLRWQNALEESGARMESGDYAGAAEVLRRTVEEVKGLTGSGTDAYLPVTMGRLSECLFHAGDARAAVEPTERALALCEAQRDDEGTRCYLGNLYEIHRYLGEGAPAATYLERRAELLERLGEAGAAARDRRQAAMVRAGEPPCRVVAQLGEDLLEIVDVPPSAEEMRFVFLRNRIALRPSTAATESGIAKGTAGDLEGALAEFRRAAEADRFDPWPSYHAGNTLLYLRRYREAIACFDETEALAPGWYHCRADRWLSGALDSGAIDHALFEALRELIDGALPPQQALTEARAALERKELGVLHLAHGDALRDLDRPAEAEAAYRRGLAIAEEPDVRTRLLLALGASVADPLEKRSLLAEASELNGNLVAAATAAVMLGHP